MVIRFAGNLKPELTIAARILSLDSLTVASGNPTTLKAGSPGDRSVSTTTCSDGQSVQRSTLYL